jgi:hypothetical protein
MENKNIINVTEIKKVERINTEVKRLNTIFRGMSDKTKKLVKSLIENAAFMAVTIEDLQDYINKNGVTEEYQNGKNQYGLKKSSQVEIHITMTKNHTQIIKQLTELLPKEQPKQEGNEFEAFIHSRED